MKDAALAGLAAIAICITIPVAVTKTARLPHTEQKTEQTQAQTAIEATTVITAEEEPFDEGFTLPVQCGAEVQPMGLQTYLIGAVLGEMPASFEPQALQAQAVACRTYVLRRYSHRKHAAAAVCTSSSCCLRWEPPENYPEEAIAKVTAAVNETDGEVILYEGALIDATFFSCSGGKTESAVAVWGSDLPYLQTVDSPGEEGAKHYSDTVTIDTEAFQETLRQADEEVVFPEDPQQWIGKVSYTDGLGVETIVLGGRSFTGKQLRKLFRLNSTNFVIQIHDEVEFTTKGYGHRVGLSQYGAEALAQQGRTHEEILKWYYSGTEIKKLPRYAPEQPC